MKEKLTIVKIGGSVIDDQKTLDQFMGAFAGIAGHKLLVHGGGKIATQLADSMGIATTMIDGRRITGDDMIDVVVMSYAGLINKKLVAMLHAKGLPSIGLTGADGNAILAAKRPLVNGVDFGWVGDIKQINDSFLTSLLSEGMTPVLAPLTHDGKGHMLNTNADTIASEVATTLADDFEVDLVFCFEKNGVLKDVEDPGSVIPELTEEKYLELKKEGVIYAGMIPKLDNAFKTLKGGVKQIKLLDVNGFMKPEEADGYTTLH